MTDNIAELAVQTAAASKAATPEPLTRKPLESIVFPVDSLGTVLAPAARAIEEKTGAPIEIGAMSLAALATLAAQRIANVKLPMGHIKPLGNYFVTVAPSGERKTACDSEAMRPLRAVEERHKEKYEKDYKTFLNDKDGYEAARAKAIKNGKGDRVGIKFALDCLGKPPEPPRHYMRTSEEPTIEGLRLLYEIGQPELGIFSSEGGHFLGGHAMSAEKRLATATALSSLWDGSGFRCVRRGDGVKHFPDAQLSVHLQMQPDVAALLMADDLLVNQGLVSRILVSAPKPKAGTRFWREPSEECEKSLEFYSNHLESIFDMAVHERRTLEFSPEARADWVAFVNFVESHIGEGGFYAPVIGFANKMPEHAARLAGMLTIVNNPMTQTIGQHELSCGIQLVYYFANEALRLTGAARIDPQLKLAEKLLSWLTTEWSQREPSGLVSLPDIYQHGPAAVRNKETAEKIINILTDHNHLEFIGPAVVNGQSRRKTWRLKNEV